MTAVPNASPSFRGKPGIAGNVHIGIGGDSSIIQSVTITWDATLVGAVTVWTTNFPDGPGGVAAGTVPLNSAANGDGWVQQQPTSGYTAISPGGSATVGASPLILNIPGGTAGSADLQIGNLGSMRMRLRVALTVDGTLIVMPHGKE